MGISAKFEEIKVFLSKQERDGGADGQPENMMLPWRLSQAQEHKNGDVFVCFAGNLTKHMKSKAHMKKCLELGVSVSMDEAEMHEHGKMLMYM